MRLPFQTFCQLSAVQSPSLALLAWKDVPEVEARFASVLDE